MNNNRIYIKYADIVAYTDTYLIVKTGTRIYYSQIEAITNAPHSISKLCREYVLGAGIPILDHQVIL